METTIPRSNVAPTIGKKKITGKDALLLAEAEALLAKGDRMIEEEVNDVREKLGSLPEFVNLSAVATHCFGKSRAWLYQRINGNKVNGKTAFLTRAERKQLVDFLHDLGKELLTVKLV